MEINFLRLQLLFISFQVIFQFNSYSQSVFIKDYQFNHLSVSRQVSLLDDGYIFYGRLYSGPVSPLSYSKILVVKTDFNGDQVWSNSYLNDSLLHGSNGLIVHDSVFYLMGSILDDTGSVAAGNLYLLKADTSGNQLDTFIVKNLLQGHYPGEMKDTPADSIYFYSAIIFSNTVHAGLVTITGDTLYTYYKINSTGTQLSGSSHNSGYFFIAGQSQISNYKIYITKTDSLLNELWTQYYSPSLLDNHCTKIFSLSDSVLVLCGYKYQTPSNPDGYVFAVDTSGIVLWESSFGGNFADIIFDIEPTSAGFVFVGSSYQSLSTSELWFGKLDNAGNLLWDTTYNSLFAINYLSDIIIDTTTGSYIMLGTVEFNTPNQHIVLVVADSTGNVTSFHEFLPNESEILLYPNPVIDFFNVYCIYRKKLIYINIYDITGKKLIQENFRNRISVDLSFLEKGIYLYTVYDDSGYLTSGKILKQ